MNRSPIWRLHDAAVVLPNIALAFLDKKGCRVIAEPTPKAIRTFNRRETAKIGLFHATC